MTLPASPARVAGVALLAPLFAALLALTAPARGQGQAPPSFVSGGQLAVCTDPGFAPMEFFRAPGDAQPVGFDMDVVAALAATWKVGLRVLPTDFKGLLPGLESGRCGLVVSGVLLTPARRERYDAVPYAATHTVLLAARGAAVLIGRAAAAMTQDVEAAYREGQVPGRLRIAYTYPEADRFAMFLKRVPGDAEAVRAAVSALKADGTLAEIARRWNLPAGALDVDPGS